MIATVAGSTRPGRERQLGDEQRDRERDPGHHPGDQDVPTPDPLREAPEPPPERQQHRDRDPERLADDPGDEDAEPETAGDGLGERVPGEPDAGVREREERDDHEARPGQQQRLGPGQRRDGLPREAGEVQPLRGVGVRRDGLVEGEVGDPARLVAHVPRTLERHRGREEREHHARERRRDPADASSATHDADPQGDVHERGPDPDPPQRRVRDEEASAATSAHRVDVARVGERDDPDAPQVVHDREREQERLQPGGRVPGQGEHGQDEDDVGRHRDAEAMGGIACPR